ncbi:MAG: efflux transporter periplasmic adaptor subunit, partial [Flavobacteriaceae bacterium]|nr:efflux transporter periplasmic adaptor subunit [Flavobacteriaceae bacterium]
KEALLQFNRITEQPFVEILTGDNSFEKKDVELGLSNGIEVEIVEGVAMGDKIKVWNKASEENNDDD